MTCVDLIAAGDPERLAAGAGERKRVGVFARVTAAGVGADVVTTHGYREEDMYSEKRYACCQGKVRPFLLLSDAIGRMFPRDLVNAGTVFPAHGVYSGAGNDFFLCFDRRHLLPYTPTSHDQYGRSKKYK